MTTDNASARLAHPAGRDDWAGTGGDSQLGSLRGSRPEGPAWFHWALAQEPERTFIDVEGAAIEMLAWGTRGNPGVLLLHGSRANADWWAFIAPLLMRDYRVVAFSMSGMGNSGHRDAYSLRQTGREAHAAAIEGGLFDAAAKPVIVAHSFGGYGALGACHDHPESYGGLVLVDSILHDLDSSSIEWSLPKTTRRVYATHTEALARFRLLPERELESLWALDAIGRSGICHDPAAGGWTWKFDIGCFEKRIAEDLSPLAKAAVPIAIVRGEESPLYTPELRDRIARLFGEHLPDIVIPDAGHHIMADQPLALATALRTLLAVWPQGGRRSALGCSEPSPL